MPEAGSAKGAVTATGDDVAGLGALTVIDNNILNPIAFVQVAVAFAFDGGIVNEHFLATFIWLDETVSLEPTKPLYNTCLS